MFFWVCTSHLLYAKQVLGLLTGSDNALFALGHSHYTLLFYVSTPENCILHDRIAVVSTNE